MRLSSVRFVTFLPFSLLLTLTHGKFYFLFYCITLFINRKSRKIFKQPLIASNYKLLFFWTAITCSKPDQPRFGSFSPRRGPFVYRTVVTFECRRGYLLRGAESVRCLVDGQWSDEFPTCEGEMKSIFAKSPSNLYQNMSSHWILKSHHKLPPCCDSKQPLLWRKS